jgi:hypothetical protein
LKRLSDAGRIPDFDNKEITELKQHLGQITRLRNDIVHFGINYQDANDDYIVSNQDFSFKEPRRHHITPSILTGAARDISKIFIRLSVLGTPNLRDDVYRVYGDLLHEPWRYTPSSQSSPDGEVGGGHRCPNPTPLIGRT